MYVVPDLDQPCNEPVRIVGWELEGEFPYGQGAKPKRILRAPTPTPHNFLIGGHRYLFKEPVGIWEQQVWTEVIAYRLAKKIGVPVPPAYLAFDPITNRAGVLVQFFYGFSWQAPRSFVHAIDFLQGLGFQTNFRRGSLKENINVCRVYQTPEWRQWWGRTLAFDSLIGNTDRHSQNWGFLVDRSEPARPSYTLAPPFDNGTSLGFIVRENDLRKYSDANRFRAFVEGGRHHCGWTAGDRATAQHAALCAFYHKMYGSAGGAMETVIQLTDADIEEVMNWCLRFSFPVPFSAARAEFVSAQLKARRAALVRAIGG